jgi:hypothetical protein
MQIWAHLIGGVSIRSTDDKLVLRPLRARHRSTETARRPACTGLALTAKTVERPDPMQGD